jgi:hypothetical protein
MRNRVEYDEDDEAADAGGDQQVRCPSCGAWVYEDAGICKKCGNYFSEEDLAGRTPVWIVVGVIVCLGVVVFMWLR